MNFFSPLRGLINFTTQVSLALVVNQTYQLAYFIKIFVKSHNMRTSWAEIMIFSHSNINDPDIVYTSMK